MVSAEFTAGAYSLARLGECHWTMKMDTAGIAPLPDSLFQQVVASTPLVSIDLIVRRGDGAILLGKRLCAPAKGFWFVPGGRVRKGETLDEAFLRLTGEELGREVPRAEASLVSVAEHFYSDSIFGPSTSTHYVVLAHCLDIEADLETLPRGQHDSYRWGHKQWMASAPSVHPYTRSYLDALD